MGSQALKGNVTSLGAGLGYFGVGAAAGALYLTPGGQAVAGSVQVVGNKGIQIATGRFDVTEINSVGDVAYLGLDIATDYFSVAPAAKIGSNLASGLQKLAGSYGSSIASGGGSIIKTGVGGSVDDIAFSVSLSDEVVVSASKVGGKGGAARESTKLLTQFSKSTIDDAVSLTMKQKGTHIFANKLHPKPWLNDLATQMGGQRNVINAALQNANGRIVPNAKGVFNTPVSVGGVNFTIRGFVNQGRPIINSIFIP